MEEGSIPLLHACATSLSLRFIGAPFLGTSPVSQPCCPHPASLCWQQQPDTFLRALTWVQWPPDILFSAPLAYLWRHLFYANLFGPLRAALWVWPTRGCDMELGAGYGHPSQSVQCKDGGTAAYSFTLEGPSFSPRSRQLGHCS